MQVKAKNGKTYDVSTAPPGGEHLVKLAGAVVGSFVLDGEATRVTKTTPDADERLLREIADTFVDLGGSPMGIA